MYLNLVIDWIVPAYTLLVGAIIIKHLISPKQFDQRIYPSKFSKNLSSKKTATAAASLVNANTGAVAAGTTPASLVNANTSAVAAATTPASLINAPTSAVNTLIWLEKFNGCWHQARADGFDEFLIFSGQGYAIRKLAPFFFFRTRQNICIQNETFYYMRDFGDGVKEWRLKFKLVEKKSDSDVVRSEIDTGEIYTFKLWYDNLKQEVYMENCPTVNNGIRVVHTRKWIDENHLQMVNYQ